MHSRFAVPNGKKPLTRQQSSRSTSRAKTLHPSHAAASSAGRVSPAASVATTASRLRSPPNAGTKRKERDFDHDMGEETNINVVVRCRGRSDREVKENSGIVVSTDGIKGNTVELSMGTTAMSNKVYNFDKVFSPAADQGIVFQEVVAPILDEVVAGFNCTIFAYGQTGTGKTYTMSGDITDTLPLPDEAGIIPRVLHTLFAKLDAEECENTVKCSFIELYNEELRDLLSVDDSSRLKIFDDAKRKSQVSTLVQGMEESHIKSASKGIDLLRLGSHKRQVAATKCNDLSSRSHTVFTITVFVKRIGDNGEELVNAGKLNLVDLAGSENIQRSGAENKRAAEAGVINKSLLTLGRVINALVDKNSHIPYRESKLTRLLQDSLGGRTKTCIIATLSPARSNLEETISTLDYAFRAKNIRNKPQMNNAMSKKTLIREFTDEIEKLKGELYATRLRNGVYLTAETYEEMTIESESRRILSEEQRDKIETMETNLRNKAQELFSLTTSFLGLKKDSEAVRQTLDGTKSVLEQTELILTHTKQSLQEEEMLRKAHETTEENLADIGHGLISTLDKATSDIGGLNSKIRRKSDLQTLNKSNWMSSQDLVSNTTNAVQQKLAAFEAEHQQLIGQFFSRIAGFVEAELCKSKESSSTLTEHINRFNEAEREVNEQTTKSRDDMNQVLDEIKSLKDDVKQKVGEGLDGLSAAAERISAGVITELDSFHTQLHSSYSAIGKEFKNTFDELVKQLNSQREEADDLRRQLCEASTALTDANTAASERLDHVLVEEKDKGAEERKKLIEQLTSLIQSQGQEQDRRLDAKVKNIQHEIGAAKTSFQRKQDEYQKAMDAWSETEKTMVDGVLKNREAVKAKIKTDWTTASEQTASIQSTTRTVHEETVRIVDTQMKDMDGQLQSLDEILARVREQNTRHHELHVQSLGGLGSSVKESYSNIGNQLNASCADVQTLEKDISTHVAAIETTFQPLKEDLDSQLSDLRTDIQSTVLTEYISTGETPQRIQYSYPTELPRTMPHESLLQNFRGPTSTEDRPKSRSDRGTASPSKTIVFTDEETQDVIPICDSPTAEKKASRPESSHAGLRELDVNIDRPALKNDQSSTETKSIKSEASEDPPPPKRQNTGNVVNGSSTVAAAVEREVRDFSSSLNKMPKKAMKEGRENMPLSASVGASGSRALRRRGS